jgi:uncharacterized membrane protein
MSNAFTLYAAPLLLLFFGRVALDAVYFQCVIPDLLPSTVRQISGQDMVASRKKYGLLTFVILTASSYFNVLFHHAHYGLGTLTAQGALLSLAIWSTFDLMVFIMFEAWTARLVLVDTVYGVASNTVLICLAGLWMQA